MRRAFQCLRKVEKGRLPCGSNHPYDASFLRQQKVEGSGVCKAQLNGRIAATSGPCLLRCAHLSGNMILVSVKFDHSI